MASGVGPAQKLEGLNIPLVSNLSGVGQNLLVGDRDSFIRSSNLHN